MTAEHESNAGVMTWVQLSIGRPGYLIAFLGLCTGTVLYFLGHAAAARGIFVVIFVLLIALPAANVAAILVEEARRRDWPFVGIAVGVLSLLAWRIAG